MKSNLSSAQSDDVGDFSGTLSELVDAYIELAKTEGKTIPHELGSQIRELGQRIESLMELVGLEEEDPELSEDEIGAYVEIVLAEVSDLLDKARSLKACLHQYSR